MPELDDPPPEEIYAVYITHHSKKFGERTFYVLVRASSEAEAKALLPALYFPKFDPTVFQIEAFPAALLPEPTNDSDTNTGRSDALANRASPGAR